MDILKELFGTCDELQINKSLFGSEVGHGDISLDQSPALNRENIQHPLPLLPCLRPPSNPPPLPLLPVEPHPHNTPIVRSHSLDNLHAGGEASEEKDLLGNYRSDSFRSQSVFARFNANPATAHVDLHSVPQEMPMYLLQEDEGNDEEIMRLMGASREASSRGDSPSDSGSGDDVVESGVQVDSMHVGEQCSTSNQASASEACVSNLVITNASGSVVMAEEEDCREFQLLVNETTNEVPVGDDISGSSSLVHDVISEIDVGKLDANISSLLGLTTAATQSEVQELSSSSDVIHDYTVPIIASVDVDIPAPGKNSATPPNVSASSLLQLHPTSLAHSKVLQDSTTSLASMPINSAFSHTTKESSIGGASSTLHNSNSMQVRLDIAKSTSSHPTSRYKHPPSAKALKSKRMMVNEGTQTTKDIHMHQKRRPASRNGSRRTTTTENARQASKVSEKRTRCLNGPPSFESRQTKATTQQSSTHSNGRKPQPAMPKESHTSESEKDGSPCDNAQHPTAVTPSSIPDPITSSAMESSYSSMPPPLDATATPAINSTASSPAVPILQSVSPAVPLMSALPRLDSPLQRTLPTLPSTATQAVTSLSASSIPTSTVSAQLLTSSAHLQLARSLLNLSSLSIPTIIPLSVSGSSEPAIAVPLPSSLVSLASTSLPMVAASQASPTAVDIQPGRSRSDILRTSTSISVQCTTQAESSNTIRHGTKWDLIQPLRVPKVAPLGLQMPSPPPAVLSSNPQHCPSGLPDTCLMGPASVSGVETSGLHQHASAVGSGNTTALHAPLTAEKTEKTQRTISIESLEAQLTPQKTLTQILQFGKEKESSEKEIPAVIAGASDSMDVSNSPEAEFQVNPSPVFQHDLTPLLQKMSGPHFPKSSTATNAATPNGTMFLSRHEKQPNFTECEASVPTPNQTSSLLLPTASHGTQDGRSSNSPDANLMIPSAISIHFPVMDQKGNQVRGRILGLAATPIELVHISNHPCSNTESREGSYQKKKRRHGGGWPKGKRRKVDDEPKPPKPPSTGYRLFLSEKWSEVQRETGCQSSPHLSKKLGHMWSALSKEEKESYCTRAGLDRQRYLEELKIYLEKTCEENSTVQFETLDKFLSQSFENETDDDILICQLCELTFTSLHNKRCHYSGKSHTEALWQELNKLSGRTKGKQTKGKKTRNSKACKSAIAPSQDVRVPQNECSERVYVSMANPNDEPMDDCTSAELDCSEVEVGMWDEATDNTTRGSGRVNHRKQQDGRRLNTSDSGIQNTNVPDSAKLEKTVKELVRTSYSAKVDGSPPCSSRMSTTPSNPVHVDVCASTLPLPISTLSSPISSVSSEKCVLGVDGGNVGTSRELPHPAQQGSMNVLLEHCETVSTCFKEFASRTTSNMRVLYEQRQLHCELLNEYSTLQQQCEESEYFCSCYEEELGHYSLADDNLCQQLASLLSLFKCTGNTALVAKLEASTDENR